MKLWLSVDMLTTLSAKFSPCNARTSLTTKLFMFISIICTGLTSEFLFATKQPENGPSIIS